MTPAAKRRRVLIIVENLPVPFEARAWNEATTLAAHGYSVSVICPARTRFQQRCEIIDGVFVYRHPLPLPGTRTWLAYVAEYATASFWQWWLTWRVLFERGFDVIHACTPPDTLFPIGLAFKLLTGTRFVFDHRDLSPELYAVKFGRRDLVYRLLLRLERCSFRVADVVISANESYRRVAVERGGVDPHRVWVVRSGPTPERLRHVAPNQALKHGREYLVGSIGAMARRNGGHYLLDAARYIVHEFARRDVQFMLIGRGKEIQALRAHSATLGIADYVTFAGRFPDTNGPEMLHTADVCVSADEVDELTDKSTIDTVMDYMAAGRPIIQFDTTEGRCSAQGAALYARPNDARDLAEKVLALLDDPERRRAMGAVGLERVRSELAWTHQAIQLLASYDAAFGERS